jgi:hypothetical protein
MAKPLLVQMLANATHHSFQFLSRPSIAGQRQLAVFFATAAFLCGRNQAKELGARQYVLLLALWTPTMTLLARCRVCIATVTPAVVSAPTADRTNSMGMSSCKSTDHHTHTHTNTHTHTHTRTHTHAHTHTHSHTGALHCHHTAQCREVPDWRTAERVAKRRENSACTAL